MSDTRDEEPPEAESPESNDSPGLEPARWEGSSRRASFGPGIPWKWILVAVPAVLLVVFFSYRSSQKTEALRAQIVADYDAQIGPPAQRVRAFRQKIEQWVMEAAQQDPEPWADPDLHIRDLREQQGLYLRIPSPAAASAETLDEAAKQMSPDAIARCLGIAPTSLRGLYEKGDFLMPSWLEQVHAAEGEMRLRVLADELERHVQRDLPTLLDLTEARYLIVALERGDNRREHPVDVFMWDLARDEPLLRLRARANGILVPVRLDFEGATRPAAPVRLADHASGAADCSIAAQIKELTGEPAMSFGSRIPEPGERSGAAAGDDPDGGVADPPGADGDAGTATPTPEEASPETT